MKLTKDSILKHIERGKYKIAVIYYGLLSAEQSTDKKPYLTLTATDTEELKKQIESFCDDHIGHNFSLELKNHNSSHGTGVNFCQLQVIEEITELKAETVSDNAIPLQGINIEEITAKIKNELQKDMELDRLKREIQELKEDKNSDSDGMNKLAIVGQQIFKQINKPQGESEADFFGLLNELSGGGFKSEVQALNGVPESGEVTDEDIKTITDFVGVQGMKNFASKIRNNGISDMHKGILKEFLS